MEQTMTQEQLLALNKTTQDTLVIIKEFEAPKELVFEVLTKHDHTRNWYSPASMEVAHSTGELKVGEKYSIGMKPKDKEGPVMELIGIFKEVDAPNKVVYTQSYMMPNGTGPETEIGIELSEDEGKTQMVFRHSGFADAQSRDQALKGGWPAAMEKIDQIIEKLSQ